MKEQQKIKGRNEKVSGEYKKCMGNNKKNDCLAEQCTNASHGDITCRWKGEVLSMYFLASKKKLPMTVSFSLFIPLSLYSIHHSLTIRDILSSHLTLRPSNVGVKPSKDQ